MKGTVLATKEQVGFIPHIGPSPFTYQCTKIAKLEYTK
ncbi:hypothetical protein AOR13_1214 [Alteromonas stellipolaris LMG 21856]|nr:hypothetical protein AOR13_1214 [Alteromonas stellipolaris LMG 21856]